MKKNLNRGERCLLTLNIGENIAESLNNSDGKVCSLFSSINLKRSKNIKDKTEVYFCSLVFKVEFNEHYYLKNFKVFANYYYN